MLTARLVHSMASPVQPSAGAWASRAAWNAPGWTPKRMPQSLAWDDVERVTSAGGADLTVVPTEVLLAGMCDAGRNAKGARAQGMVLYVCGSVQDTALAVALARAGPGTTAVAAAWDSTQSADETHARRSFINEAVTEWQAMCAPDLPSWNGIEVRHTELVTRSETNRAGHALKEMPTPATTLAEQQDAVVPATLTPNDIRCAVGKGVHAYARRQTTAVKEYVQTALSAWAADEDDEAGHIVRGYAVAPEAHGESMRNLVQAQTTEAQEREREVQPAWVDVYRATDQHKAALGRQMCLRVRASAMARSMSACSSEEAAQACNSAIMWAMGHGEVEVSAMLALKENCTEQAEELERRSCLDEHSLAHYRAMATIEASEDMTHNHELCHQTVLFEAWVHAANLHNFIISGMPGMTTEAPFCPDISVAEYDNNPMPPEVWYTFWQVWRGVQGEEEGRSAFMTHTKVRNLFKEAHDEALEGAKQVAADAGYPLTEHGGADWPSFVLALPEQHFARQWIERFAQVPADCAVPIEGGHECLRGWYLTEEDVDATRTEQGLTEAALRRANAQLRSATSQFRNIKNANRKSKPSPAKVQQITRAQDLARANECAAHNASNFAVAMAIMARAERAHLTADPRPALPATVGMEVAQPAAHGQQQEEEQSTSAEEGDDDEMSTGEMLIRALGEAPEPIELRTDGTRLMKGDLLILTHAYEAGEVYWVARVIKPHATRKDRHGVVHHGFTATWYVPDINVPRGGISFKRARTEQGLQPYDCVLARVGMGQGGTDRQFHLPDEANDWLTQAAVHVASGSAQAKGASAVRHDREDQALYGVEDDETWLQVAHAFGAHAQDDPLEQVHKYGFPAGGRHANVAEGGEIPASCLTRKMFSTLQEAQQLDAEVVNTALWAIFHKIKATGRSAAIVNTSAHWKWVRHKAEVEEAGGVSVFRDFASNLPWWGDEDPDVVIVPLYPHNNHWTVAMVNAASKTIEYSDSAVEADKGVLAAWLSDVRSFVLHVVAEGYSEDRPLTVSDAHPWDIVLQDSPQQIDGLSCGVFMLAAAATMALREDLMQPATAEEFPVPHESDTRSAAMNAARGQIAAMIITSNYTLRKPRAEQAEARPDGAAISPAQDMPTRGEAAPDYKVNGSGEREDVPPTPYVQESLSPLQLCDGAAIESGTNVLVMMPGGTNMRRATYISNDDNRALVQWHDSAEQSVVPVAQVHAEEECEHAELRSPAAAELQAGVQACLASGLSHCPTGRALTNMIDNITRLDVAAQVDIASAATSAQAVESHTLESVVHARQATDVLRHLSETHTDAARQGVTDTATSLCELLCGNRRTTPRPLSTEECKQLGCDPELYGGGGRNTASATSALVHSALFERPADGSVQFVLAVPKDSSKVVMIDKVQTAAGECCRIVTSDGNGGMALHNMVPVENAENTLACTHKVVQALQALDCCKNVAMRASVPAKKHEAQQGSSQPQKTQRTAYSNQQSEAKFKSPQRPGKSKRPPASPPKRVKAAEAAARAATIIKVEPGVAAEAALPGAPAGGMGIEGADGEPASPTTRKQVSFGGLKGSGQVFLRTLSGRSITLDLPDEMQFEALCAAVTDREGIPATEMRIIFAGREMHGNSTVQEQGLRTNSTAHLLLRLRGGQGAMEVDHRASAKPRAPPKRGHGSSVATTVASLLAVATAAAALPARTVPAVWGTEVARWGTQAGVLSATNEDGTPQALGTCTWPLRVNCMNVKGAQGRSAQKKLAPLLEHDHVLCPELHQGDFTIMTELKGDDSKVNGEGLHARLAHGRASYWTGHVGIVVSPRMLDVPMVATKRQGGRVLQLTFQWHGERTHVIGVYGPGCPDHQARENFYRHMWIPQGDTIIILGDFNTVSDSMRDIRAGGTGDNPGGSDWNDKAEAAGLFDVKLLTGDCSPGFTFEGPHVWGTDANYARRIDRIHVTGDVIASNFTLVEPWTKTTSLDHAALSVIVARDGAKTKSTVMRKMAGNVIDKRNTSFLMECNAIIDSEYMRVKGEHVDPALKVAALDNIIEPIQTLYEKHEKEVKALKHAAVKRARANARAHNEEDLASGGKRSRTRQDEQASANSAPYSPPGTPPSEPHDGSATAIGPDAKQTFQLVSEAIEVLTLQMQDTEEAFDVDHDTFGDRAFYKRHVRKAPTAMFTSQHPACFNKDEQVRSPNMKLIGEGGFSDGSDMLNWTESSPPPPPPTVGADGRVRGAQAIRNNTRSHRMWKFRKRQDHVPSQQRLLSYARAAPRFNQMAVRDLGKRVTVAETNAGVKRLRPARAPGPDGATTEFFQGLDDLILAPFLTMVFNAAFDTGKLPWTMRQGTIVLLYKSGDRDNLDNWRPITLISRYAMVLANIMTTRLEKYMDQIIQQDQTAFVPGRQMHENVLKISDALAYASDADLPTALMSVDARQAYDCVSHATLFSLLDIACESTSGASLNRGTAALAHVPTAAESIAYSTVQVHAPRADFTTWVMLLTTDAVRQILVNGMLTDPFTIEAGVPQGSSLSPALFTVFCNPLGVMMQLHLEGIRLPATNADGDTTVRRNNGVWSVRRLTTVRFADDVNFFVREHEVSLAFDILECWCQGCGAGLNAAKSLGMWAGSLRDRTTPWRASPRETPGYSCWKDEAPSPDTPPPRCRWLRPGQSMRVLGVQVGYKVDYDALWRKVGTNMLTAMRMWGRVRLSLPARVMVLKTMIYSRCWFLAAYTPHHKPTLQLVRKAGLLFVHRGMLPAGITVHTPPGDLRVPAALNYPAVSATYAEGGLGLWDPIEQIRILHSKWIWLLLQPPAPVRNAVATWQHLPRYYMAWHTCRQDDRTRELGALVDGQQRTLLKRVGSVLPPLWQRAVRAWAQVRDQAKLALPTQAEHVPSCTLWDNVLVRNAMGPLEPPPGWMRAGIKHVGDVWHWADGRLSTAAELQAAAPDAQRHCISQPLVDAVTECIPAEWLTLLNGPCSPHENGEWVRPRDGGQHGTVYLVREHNYDQYVWSEPEQVWAEHGTFLPEWLQIDYFDRVIVQLHPNTKQLLFVVGRTQDVWATSPKRLTWKDEPFVVRHVRRVCEQPRDTMPQPATKLADTLRLTTALEAGQVDDGGVTRGTVWNHAVKAVWASTWPPRVRDETWRCMVGAAYYSGYRRHFDAPTAMCRHCMYTGEAEYDTPSHALTECPMLTPLWKWAKALLARVGYTPFTRDGFMLYGALAPTAHRTQQYVHQLPVGHPAMAIRGAMAAGYSRWRAICNRPPPEGEDRLPPPPPKVATMVAERVFRRMVEMDFLEATKRLQHREPSPRDDGELRERRPRPETPPAFDAKWLMVARTQAIVPPGGRKHKMPQLSFELVYDADEELK